MARKLNSVQDDYNARLNAQHELSQRTKPDLIKKKLLFVCFMNIDRSPTAEEIIKESKVYSKKYEVRSCGVSQNARSTISRKLIEWADRIFVMEDEQKKFILKSFSDAREKEIIVLNIPNIYKKEDPKLKILMKKALAKWL